MTNVRNICLVDSNVFVYAADAAERAKQEKAASILDALAVAHRGALSVQVLGEAFTAITRKIVRPVPPRRAVSVMDALTRSFTVFPITAWTVREGFRAVVEFQMSYWDALIWATAKLNGITRVLTEDIQSNGSIEGISFVDPFAQHFDLGGFLESLVPGQA